MAALFRILDVHSEGSDRVYSFTLYSGETRLLQLSSEAEKDAMIDLVIGEAECEKGNIEIVQDDRKRNNIADTVPLGEGKHDNEATPTNGHGEYAAPDDETHYARLPLSSSDGTTSHSTRQPKSGSQVAGYPPEGERDKDSLREFYVRWQSLSESHPGRVGWVAANGGLISNLKIWENVTLPLWYHEKREENETEQNVTHWLGALGMEQDAFAEFMAASPFSSELWQRKLAGLLRALVQMPTVLVVDAVVFENVKEHWSQSWITALEAYAAQGHAVLVIADKAMALPWKKIE